MNDTLGLKRFYQLSWKDVPSKVKHFTKLHLLDTLGALLSGNFSKAGLIASNFSEEIFPGSESTIFVEGIKESSPPGAAFANSILASALDIDDGFRPAAGHPGSVVIPSALAIGERLKVSGSEYLKAVLTGYEVAMRTGKAMYVNSGDRFFGSGAWASSGAAAAVAHLYHHSFKNLIQSIGIAEAHAPISPNMRSIANSSMVKESIGWGSLTGLTSAELASRNFQGVNPIIFEKQNKVNIKEFGKHYYILDTYIKPYASCRWTHPPIEGLKKVIKNNSSEFEEASIEKIEVYTFSKALSLSDKNPSSGVGAQYSIPYTLAAFLINGKVGPRQTSSRPDKTERVRKLSRKVELKVDPKIEKRFPEEALAKVIITTEKGNNFNSGVVRAKGGPQNPLTESEIKDKFNSLVSEFITSRDIKKIVKKVENLERNDLLDLIHLLRVSLKNKKPN